jgi:NAD(P)-dependent dehydrogenase (short-subunit alcohol dehydrogenase family)
MSGKTVFITGGAGGLGGSTARYLAERDWRVFAADFDEDALGVIGKEPNVTPVLLDVTDPVSVDTARHSMEEVSSGLDGIVNFAGILAVGSMVEIEEAALRRVLDVNVMGTFRVNRALFPLVLARKGRIVNISSETGWQCRSSRSRRAPSRPAWSQASSAPSAAPRRRRPTSARRSTGSSSSP